MKTNVNVLMEYIRINTILMSDKYLIFVHGFFRYKYNKTTNLDSILTKQLNVSN